MKIGVFDSGIGGLSVAQAIERDLPDLEIIFKSDSAHVPYGTKSSDEIYEYILPILESFVEDGCAVVVIACNTVTTTLIGRIRQNFDIPFVAVEPMVKPAATLTETGIIAVCATPTTLASPRYAELKKEYASNVKVLEPNCSDWAFMIEKDQLDEKIIENRIQEVVGQGADVIVLACTHYHWIEDTIKEAAGSGVMVIQPEAALIRQLRRVLELPV